MSSRLRKSAAFEFVSLKKLWRTYRENTNLQVVAHVPVFVLVVAPACYLMLAYQNIRAALGRPCPLDERHWPTKLETLDETSVGTVVSFEPASVSDGLRAMAVTIEGPVGRTEFTSEGVRQLERDEMQVLLPGDSEALTFALQRLLDTKVPVEARQRLRHSAAGEKVYGACEIASIVGDVRVRFPHR